MSDAGEVLLMIYERICLCEAAAGVPPEQSAVDGTFGLHIREWVWCPDCQLRSHRQAFMQSFYETPVGGEEGRGEEAGCVCLCVWAGGRCEEGPQVGGRRRVARLPSLCYLQATGLRQEAALAAAQRTRGIIERGTRTMAGRLARMAQQVGATGCP